MALFLPAIGIAADEVPTQILFQNVKIFDGNSDQLISGKDVLIEGNLIKAVGSGLAVASDMQVIDGGGRTLMPGMIDSHLHFASYTPFNINARQSVNEFMVRDINRSNYTPQEDQHE